MLSWEKLLTETRRKDKLTQTGVSVSANGRHEIERDYDRILFAAPTRRLADKTQVFPLDKNDSVRTRLTHSHEVSTLARSIGLRLAYEHREIFEDNLSDEFVQRGVPSLLAAIGLVHDLGNPPFGHQGEFAIQDWFRKNCKEVFGVSAGKADDMAKDFLHFDGNAQTVRLVSKLQILSDQFGLNLTYATLAGLIKYPVPVRDRNPDKWKKQGYFKSEEDVIHDVWTETGLTKGVRHPLTYIMEACDDIAYSVMDAEDTIKKGLASYYDLIRYLKQSCQSDRITESVITLAEKKNLEFQNSKLSPQEVNDCSMQMFRVYAITAMISSTVSTFAEKSNSLMLGESLYKGLIGSSDAAIFCKTLKKFDLEYGFKHKSVLELELKGNNLIKELMDMLWVGIKGRLREDHDSQTPFGKYVYSRISENYRRIFEDEGNPLGERYKEAQLLADTISGMTDSYLIALHSELKPLYDQRC